jgi:Calcineurin-like phosphoesterase
MRSVSALHQPPLSSRQRADHAGWVRCRAVKPVSIPPQAGQSGKFSWASPRSLWECRNQIIGDYLGDPTAEHRRRWLELLGRCPEELPVVDAFKDLDRVSFVVMGDTGEGDASQYRVVPTLLAQAKDTHFMFICGDVAYPAGGIEQYGVKVLAPYRDYLQPIYAIPGSHSWYDDADGFMYWFCNADERPQRPAAGRLHPRELLWRRSPQGHTDALIEMAKLRPEFADSAYDDHRHLQVVDAPAGRGVVHQQPGPYFALQAGRVTLVALDLGLDGPLDSGQRQWFLKTSAQEGPKILLLKPPLYVDGERFPRPMEGGMTIHDVVTNPHYKYIAVISGHTHNYQRYLVTLDGGRRMPFIVAGGGGAFLHETHTIPNLDEDGPPGVDEDSFRCYPLRGDSLARCAQLWDRKLGGTHLLTLDPDVAAYIAAERLGMVPVRATARTKRPSRRDRRVAALMYRLPGHPPDAMHTIFSSLLDWGIPPLFKHFLGIEATGDKVTITCHAVTGCVRHVEQRLIEDRLIATRHGEDWEWTQDPEV